MKPKITFFFGRDAMHCVSTILFIICIMAISCKKPEDCKLKLTEEQKQAGWVIVGSGKDCYVQKPDDPAAVNPEIKSMADLQNNQPKYKQAAESGKTLALKLTGDLVPTPPQLLLLDELGDLLIVYPNVTLNNNGHFLRPAESGMLLTYYRWTNWNKINLGEGVLPPDKNGKGIKWTIPENEIGLFVGDGQDGDAIVPGPKATETTLNIKNNATWQSFPADAQNEINKHGYEKVFFKLMGAGFNLGNGADMTALNDIYAMVQAGTSGGVVHSNFKGMMAATDSVNPGVGNFQNLNMLEQLGALKWDWNHYFFNSSYGEDGHKTIPSQRIRVPEMVTTDGNLWSKAIPNKLTNNEKYNAQNIPAEIFANYVGYVKVVQGYNPEFPCNQAPWVGIGDRELNSLRLPSGGELAGTKFILWSNEDLILAEYFIAGTGAAYLAPDGLRNNEANFGPGTNKGGQNLDASHNRVRQFIKDNITGETPLVCAVRNQLITINVNIKTNVGNHKTNDGKTIVNCYDEVPYDNSTGYGFIPGLWEITGTRSPGKMHFENVLFYATGFYFKHVIETYGMGQFFNMFQSMFDQNINCTVDTILPPGKEPYTWITEQYGKGGRAAKITGAQPNSTGIPFNNVSAYRGRKVVGWR